MKYLSPTVNTVPNLDHVRKYITDKRQEVETAVQKIEAESLWPLGMIGTVISALLLIGTLIWMAPDHTEWVGYRIVSREWYRFPLFGKICLAILPLSLFQWIYSGTKAIKAAEPLKAAKRREMNGAMAIDPLYQRAILIDNACQSFWAHVCKYRAIFEAVEDKGVMKPERARVDAYYTFITRSHRAICKAADNFRHVLDQQNFKDQHPEIAASPESASLTDLLRRLDEPVELPPDVGQLAIEETLDHETALGRLGDEIDGTALAKQIDEAAQAAGLRSPARVAKAN